MKTLESLNSAKFQQLTTEEKKKINGGTLFGWGAQYTNQVMTSVTGEILAASGEYGSYYAFGIPYKTGFRQTDVVAE